MSVADFDRDALARWYAERHLKVDDAVREVHYLPDNSGDREIRLVEVNDRIEERADGLSPIDFGVDMGQETAHRLVVIDVTPAQWRSIAAGELHLPTGWSLDGSRAFGRR